MNKNAVLLFSLLLSFSLFAQEQEQEREQSQPQPEPSRNQKLMSKLATILDKVEASYPEFSTFTAQSDDKLINGFIRSLDGRIEILDKKKIPAPARVPDPFFKAVPVASGTLLYCRIDSFNQASLKQLAADLETTNAKDSKIAAVVIDLRNCSGSMTDCAIDALRLLCDNKKLPVASGNKRVLQKPFAVLVSDKTSGTAEVFSYIVKDKSIALLIGSKTAGKPFEYRFVDLYDDKALAVPVIPEFLKKMSVRPVMPDIESQSAQIPYEKISKAPDSITEDKAISLASDILKSVNIFIRK